LAEVTLALVVLPSTIQAVITPETPAGELPAPGAWIAVALIAFVIGILGQLSLVRLAIGPATSVGEAIAHGARRLPIYIGSLLMWLVPLGVALYALAAAIKTPANPAIALAFVLLASVTLFFAVRLIIAPAVASAEAANPVRILQRSWSLTNG